VASIAGQWRATLETYAYPIIGDFPVQMIETAHVMKIVQPIWETFSIRPRPAGRFPSWFPDRLHDFMTCAVSIICTEDHR